MTRVVTDPAADDLIIMHGPSFTTVRGVPLLPPTVAARTAGKEWRPQPHRDHVVHRPTPFRKASCETRHRRRPAVRRWPVRSNVPPPIFSWHYGAVAEVLDWLTGRGLIGCNDPEVVDAALDRHERHAGVALIGLVLHHHDPHVVLPRLKRGLRSPNPPTRANAALSLGHFARLHGLIDGDSLALLRRALRDRTVVGGYPTRGTAEDAAGDVGYYAPRHDLPRWLRRHHRRPGPRPQFPTGRVRRRTLD
ncbi:hypothetical protein AB0C02_32070 [Micromonospora sp. NPDC048999]|uniref:hypothetical protein n=1 Tax=Micromonospora sp. NPDC048999 TaxID=3155391 RepID=UPI00340004A1